MDDTESDSRPDFGAEQNPALIAALADDIVTAIEQTKALPSLAVLVGCMEEARERLPYVFDEQLELLRSIRRSANTRLKKSGKNRLVRELGEIIGYLEQCGDLPIYPFGLIIERLPQMDPYAAGRYLEGVAGLERTARYPSAERRLLALLGGADNRDAPFAWSDRERNLFKDVVKRYEENIAEALGIAAAARPDELPAAQRPDDAVSRAEVTAGSGRGRVRWKSTLVTLVFIADRLRKSGMIDPEMTDAEIIESCDYPSRSKKPDEVFRGLRLKLQRGGAHPKRDKLLSLIALLLEGLPPEDLKTIKEGIEASLKRK